LTSDKAYDKLIELSQTRQIKQNDSIPENQVCAFTALTVRKSSGYKMKIHRQSRFSMDFHYSYEVRIAVP
jgi:hypothetical protein